MSETIEPPIPLPPASPDAAPRRTRTQVAAVFIALFGGVMTASSFMPLFMLSGYSNGYYTAQNYSMYDTPDGPLFAFAGVLLIALGIGAYLTNHRAFALMAGLTCAVVIVIVSGDSQNVSARADQMIVGTGVTFTWGPAVTLVLITAIGALISALAMVKPASSK